MENVYHYQYSYNYWEYRYMNNGTSGEGAYGKYAIFKADIVNNFIIDNNIIDVIDFGCGDGNQLKYLNIKKYVGCDVSETSISICNMLYINDNTKDFFLIKNLKKDKYNLSLSLDVIYHLIEDYEFEIYMKNLFDFSNKYVIIYSSNHNNNESVAKHIKNRTFSNWIDDNVNNFKLLKYIKNKYPYDGNGGSISNFHIYKKI